MAQLINSSINLTLDGANGASIPQGTLVYRPPGTTVDVPATVTIPVSSGATFRDSVGTAALSGTLRSPTWPSNYPANCSGYVYFPGLAGITRTLSGTVSTTFGDLIRVYEGVDTSGKMLYQVTGTGQNFSFTSAAGQDFTVQFVSGASAGSTSFSLSVTGERVGTYLSYDSGVSSPYIIGEDGEPSPGYRSTTVTRYDANGTWLNPLYLGQNISMVFVFALGGGGGGAKGPNTTTNTTQRARGGAGGGASMVTYPAFALGPVYPITVGAGGTGSTSTVSPTGGSGGTSSFGDIPGNSDALIGGSAWFNTVFAGGGSGGALAASADAAALGGYGLYVGAPTAHTFTVSNYYAGASGGGGSFATAVGAAGGSSGGNIATAAAGGNPGGDSSLGQNGISGTTPSVGLRAGGGGGGGGKATTAPNNGGRGGNGGRGAGGGGGGGCPTGGNPGDGGDGGAGYVVVVSW
jgi:hypothetical protein